MTLSPVIAYIPARLGSKRVPKKNLRPLLGVPLITHAARILAKATQPTSFYVNTESMEIAEAGRAGGAEIYMRVPDLAQDHVKTDEILYDFARNFKGSTVAIVNPTAPLLKPETIDRFILKHGEDPERTLFSVTRLQKHFVMEENPINFAADRPSPRTQDLVPLCYVNFIIIVVSADKMIREYENKGYSLYAVPVGFAEIPEEEAIDIDTEWDFIVAEALLNAR